MKRADFGCLCLIIALFASPYICFGIVQPSLGFLNSSPVLILVWLATMCTNVFYFVVHFIFFRKQTGRPYYEEPFTKTQIYGPTFFSLLPFGAGTLFMFAYTGNNLIAVLSLLIIVFRFLLVAFFGKPYLARREARYEVIPDLLIIFSFGYIGYITHSPLWWSGTIAWLIYAVLNQYHSSLILRRGYGYASVVGSVAFACTLLAICSWGEVETNFGYIYATSVGGAYVIAIALLAPHLIRMRSLLETYMYSMFTFPITLAILMVAMLFSGYITLEPSSLIPLTPEATAWESVVALGGFIGVFSMSLFIILQAIFLRVPDAKGEDK